MTNTTFPPTMRWVGARRIVTRNLWAISRRCGLWVLSGRLPIGRCQLEPDISFRHFFWISWGYSAHLSWCVISGASSFRRAISVCMNLLYAVSFLRPPPPEDLTVRQVSQSICILIVGHENAPFRSGFSLGVFFSLGIERRAAYNWSIGVQT